MHLVAHCIRNLMGNLVLAVKKIQIANLKTPTPNSESWISTERMDLKMFRINSCKISINSQPTTGRKT